MDSFENLIEKVKQWGRDRNLTDPLNVKNQFNKLVSEFGEIGEGILNSDEDEIEDGVGDTMVVCIILGEQLGRSLIVEDFERNWTQEGRAGNWAPVGYHMLFAAQSKLGLLADNIGKNQTAEACGNLVQFLQCIVSYCYMETGGLYSCLDRAYNEIKDRKGVLYNGVFIKESDPRYESAKAELVARQLGQDSAYQLNRPPEQ